MVVQAGGDPLSNFRNPIRPRFTVAKYTGRLALGWLAPQLGVESAVALFALRGNFQRTARAAFWEELEKGAIMNVATSSTPHGGLWMHGTVVETFARSRRARSLVMRQALLACLLVVIVGCQKASDANAPPSAGVAETISATTTQRPATPPGPDAAVLIPEAYARMVARDAYFSAWPMINIWNKRLAFAQIPEPGLMNGVLPGAPLNHMGMLTDYVDPTERFVACPNQDVVYGGGVIALDKEPVVLQVPDFGKRFWVYQVVDLRTDSFADLGAMYDTKPGFYLLVGPNWKGQTPNGITKVFRSTSNTGFFGPRVFQDDTQEDKRAVQDVLSGIAMYPLSEFDGSVKKHDWSTLPKFPSAPGSGGKAETRWVFPETFFDQLPAVLADAPPLPGEEARYAQLRAVLDAAQKDPAIKKAMVDEATKADADLIAPLLEFRNWGVPLANNWRTVTNGAKFGTDYFTRTAVGKSNILVNKPNEAKYFYQDLDASGARLNSRTNYTVTFAKGALPPVNGFWSLTLYNAEHFFEDNAIKRFSVGTKNRDLHIADDGSLTIYVQPDAPADRAQRANWLPAPKGGRDFSLYLRAYWAKAEALDGRWTPPAVKNGG